MAFDLGHIWASMSLMSKIVALVLFVYGVIVIGVTVERLIALGRSAAQSRVFARSAGKLIEEWNPDGLVQLAERHQQSALARVFAAVTRRFDRGMHDLESGVSPVDLARNEAVRQKEQVGHELRRGLGILASIGSTAPFVGLLGTVLGIIAAFQGIAATGGGGLGAVSAGIAEALIETAFGLFVAIPSVLLYNYFMARANTVELALERSAGELLDEMEVQHGHELEAGPDDAKEREAAAA
jgi:biopolymer transport protein ExbB